MAKYPNTASRMLDMLRFGKMVGLRVLEGRCQNTNSRLVRRAHLLHQPASTETHLTASQPFFCLIRETRCCI